MKLVLTGCLFFISVSAMAMEYTGRLELKDSMTSTSSCGSSGSCSANSTTGFGVGVTTKVYNFATSWDLVTGGLFRQRVGSVSYGSTTSSGSYTYLDIPVAGQWSSGDYAVRLGLDLGLKLSSSYTNISSSAVSDNSLITPVELAFDWKLTQSHLITLAYETGSTLAAGQNGGSNLSTSTVFTVGYGYIF